MQNIEKPLPGIRALLAATAMLLILLIFSGCEPASGSGCDQGAVDPGQGPDSNSKPSANINKNEPDEFEPVKTGPGGTAYKDSAHFRIYSTGAGADRALALVEGAYQCFITDWGHRSTGLSTHDDANDGPYYKTNIYPKPMSAGGYMQYDYNKGLAYLEVNSAYIGDPKIIVHEYGHAITLHEINWMDQTRTGAWWESTANWAADTFMNSKLCESARKAHGLGEMGTLIDLDRNISMAHYTIVHDQNYYQAWPFFTYLTNNPDNYPGLGKMALPNLYRNHRRNNETPLHVLERVAAPVSVQKILGRYWAHMAYLDIGHPSAQQAFFNSRSRLNFANLSSAGSQTYRVKANRQPMYGGANIIPLKMSGNNVDVEVINLGNGRPDSNFTATLAVRNKNNGTVRYVDLPRGIGRATVGSNEEASLVVVNTPDTLIQYDAFKSSAGSPEQAGLNYQVQITGATPTS